MFVQGVRSTQAVAKPTTAHSQQLSSEQAFDYATYHDISVVVVNLDTSGLRFAREFRTIFPETAMIAISKNATSRAAATRFGAVAARNDATSARITSLIARALRR